MLEAKTIFNIFDARNGLAELAVIFGRNGSGKSTLADGFRKISGKSINEIDSVELFDNNNEKIEVDEVFQKNIHVFNEDFIDRNIKMKSKGLDAIILFGEQAELDDKIEKVKKYIEGKQKECNELSAKLNEYDDKNNILSPENYKTKILKKLRDGKGWAERDSYIKDNRRRSDVNDSIINEIANLKVQESKLNLQSKYQQKIEILNSINEKGSVISEEVQQINNIEIDNLELSNLLKQKIERPILDDRDKKIISLVKDGNIKKAESIKNTFEQKEIEHCPYCFQDVTERYKDNLVSSIEKILSKNVENHIIDLEKYKTNTISLNLSKYNILDIKLISSIQEKISELSKITEEYNKAIDKKIDNIYKPVFLEVDHSKIYASLKEDLKKLEIKRKEYNHQLENKEKLKEDLIKINKNIAYLEIRNDYVSYKKQLEEQEKIVAKHATLKTDLEEREQYLLLLHQQKDHTLLAVDIINDSLKYIFFAEDRLFIEQKSKNYILYSNGKAVKPESISLGERNAIALCYYFTQILDNLNESQLYKNENFLILDDPISSFDMENQMGILSYLKSQFSKILKGNSKSKILVLSHDLLTVDSIDKIYQELKVSIKQSSDGHIQIKSISKMMNRFELDNFTGKHNNDYSQLLQIIYEYGKKDKEELKNSKYNLVIGNIMRRVLEAFAMFEYRIEVENLTTDKKMLDIIPKEYHEYFENLMYRIVLHQESHLRDRSYDPSRLNFYDYLSSEEKQRTARSILVLINILNTHHLNAHLDSNSGTKEIDIIKGWEENI